MTEVERLVSKGIINRSFLDEEQICGFIVNENRKKIWAIEIDLLLEIDRVCKKYGLRYFLFFGSLLGAIRHNGFIPWDDDTDIVMPREDYEVLIQHKDEFKTPYFLQTPYTDNGFFYAHAKLRNSYTSAIDFPFKYQGFNMGIFVDILPIDKIDINNSGEELFNTISHLIILNSIAMRLTNPHLSERDSIRVSRYPGGDPLQRYQEIQLLSQRDKLAVTDDVCVFAAVTYGFKKDVFKAKNFETSVNYEFHGYQLPVPIGFDNVLKTIYGDYMKMPPLDQRGIWHGNVSFYPDVPYSDII